MNGEGMDGQIWSMDGQEWQEQAVRDWDML